MDQRQEIEFDLAVGEVVKNLVGGTVRAVLDRPKFVHVIEIKIGDAPAFDFSSDPKLLERFHCFLEPHVSLSPMQKIKIDCVDSEAFETSLACFW